jgi:hypothetical protein
MIVRPAVDYDVYCVCYKLRAISVEEAEVIRGQLDRPRMARDINNLKPFAVFRDALCLDTGEVVAIVAAYSIQHGMAAVHMIATEKWAAIAPAAYRHIRRLVRSFPALGIRYAGTDVLDRGFADRRWLRRLGFMDEGPPVKSVQRVAWRAVDAAFPGLGLPDQETAAHV